MSWLTNFLRIYTKEKKTESTIIISYENNEVKNGVVPFETDIRKIVLRELRKGAALSQIGGKILLELNFYYTVSIDQDLGSENIKILFLES